MSYKIRLIDKKCGLHMDFEIEHLIPTFLRVVDYGTGIHEYEYRMKDHWPVQDRYLYVHTKTRKICLE
jgi:hypothetical protein